MLEDCGARGSDRRPDQWRFRCLLSEREFISGFAFEDVPTAGSFMIFGLKRRDMFEVARNFSHFFAHESCGFCTPCRMLHLLKNIMDKIAEQPRYPVRDEQLLRLQQVLKPGSHCGLGQTAGNAVADTVQKFRPAYERRLAGWGLCRAFDLDAALARARGRPAATTRPALGEEA